MRRRPPPMAAMARIKQGGLGILPIGSVGMVMNTFTGAVYTILTAT
jgi:hypothetical protein